LERIRRFNSFSLFSSFPFTRFPLSGLFLPFPNFYGRKSSPLHGGLPNGCFFFFRWLFFPPSFAYGKSQRNPDEAGGHFRFFFFFPPFQCFLPSSSSLALARSTCGWKSQHLNTFPFFLFFFRFLPPLPGVWHVIRMSSRRSCFSRLLFSPGTLFLSSFSFFCGGQTQVLPPFFSDFPPLLLVKRGGESFAAVTLYPPPLLPED